MTQSNSAPYSVLFDLDGTLLDTAPDLAAALNKLLMSEGLTERAFEEIRPVVSHGGNALIQFGFNITPQHPRFAALRQNFLDNYQNDLSTLTELFPGMQQLLVQLEERAIPWGIVTNKPAWLTDPLMLQMGLSERAACIVSGDTTEYAKPHPAPLYYACKQTNHDPQHCIYVGDHQRDIEAGNRAGMKTLGALFGYIGEQDNPQQWQADGLIQSPLEILDYLKKWKGNFG